MLLGDQPFIANPLAHRDRAVLVNYLTSGSRDGGRQGARVHADLRHDTRMMLVYSNYYYAKYWRSPATVKRAGA